MANARDITSGNSNVLIIGDAGSHKTFFLGGVPDIYVFDFDAGMVVNRGKNIEYDTFKDLTRYNDTGKPFEADDWDKKQGLHTFGYGWDAFYKQLLAQVGKIKTKAPGAPKALGFDSLTMMSMLAVNKILKDTGQPSPHQGTWGAHHEYFKTIFSMVTALPVRIFATAHIERGQNDLSQVVEKLPLLTGKLAPLIPIFFDEVWFAETEDSTKGIKYKLRTSRAPQYTMAKSRWNVPEGTETLWSAVSPFMPSVPTKP